MRMRHPSLSSLACLVIVVGLAPSGCKRESGGGPGTTGEAAPGGAGAAHGEFAPPEVDVGKLPSALQMKLGAARTEARRAGSDAAKVGELGALYYVHGFPQAAAACFARAAAVAPQEPAWPCYLGLAQEHAGNGAAAATAYDVALAIDGKCQLARVRSALLLIQKDPKRLEQAEKLLHQAVAADPANLAAQLGLARCAQAAGRADEAVAGLRRILAAAPDCASAHRALAALLTGQGKAEEAARHERRAAASERDLALADPLEILLLQKGLDVDVLLSDARAAVAVSDLAAAEQLVKTALDIAPDEPRARIALGLLRARQGRKDEAVAELQRAVESQPDLGLAKSALGQALAESGKPDEAERLFREVLEREPGQAETVQRYIAVMTGTGKLDEAQRFLEATLAAHPAEPALEYGLAEALMAAQRPADAVPHLRQAIELAPENVQVRHALAVALYSQGDRAGARAEWEQALRTDPRFVAAYMALNSVALEEKNTAAALEVLRKGLTQVPEAHVLANALAWTLATAADPQQRNGAEAVELAKKACAATRNRDHAYLDTLAVALAEAGRFDDAIRAEQQAITVATSAGAAPAAESYRSRLTLYEQKQAYHEPQ